MIARLGLVLLCALCSSCATLTSVFTDDHRFSRADEIPGAIELARTEAESGDTREALDIVRSARKVDGLEADVRNQLDVLVERYAQQRIHELSAPGSKPRELANMLELGLPQQIAVDAGVQAARLYLDQGRPFKAYSMLKKLETQYPRHHGKVEAGAILFEAGMGLADDSSSFLGFFSARDDGIEVLEFLVLTYPLERRCDEAFFKLATLYEEDELWELARQRHEELLYAHIKSALASASEARIPHLRLAGLSSPEYDRRELLKARAELEAWLAHHGGRGADELEQQVRLDYADTLARLIASDMGIARFYRRIAQPFGARLHAARAVELARTAGDPALLASTETLLASIPDVSELPGGASKPGEEAFSADESLIRSLQQRTPEPVPVAPPVEGSTP